MCFHHPVCKLFQTNFNFFYFFHRFSETGAVLIMRLLFLRGAWDVLLPHWVAQYHKVWPRTSLLQHCACLTRPNGFPVDSITGEKRLNWEMIQCDLSYMWASEIPAQQCTWMHLESSPPVWMRWKIKSKQQRNSWPQHHSCQALSTLNGLLEGFTSWMGRAVWAE